MTYKHLFFDLDHTLWDFETNSRVTLLELFEELQIQSLGIPNFDAFFTQYKLVNDALWARYRKGEVSKDELRSSRFLNTLKAFEVDRVDLAEYLEEHYIGRSPYQKNLLPDAMETLQELSKRYAIHIVTNGFSEVQDVKIDNSGLKPFITHRISSELVGVQKPNPKVFHYALKVSGAKRKDSLMIGDSLEADVIGARRAGIEAVYFNPGAKPHGEQLKFEIRRLRELLDWI
jgi:putative hydrolase of the HAD superfamily